MTLDALLRTVVPNPVTLVVALSVIPGHVQSQPSRGWRDTVFAFAASDGAALEGKLSIPTNVAGRSPVVFYLHGAGPRTTDHAIRYRADDGQVRTIRYYDYSAAELAARGIAFFRIAKRGVTADTSGRPIIDRAIFSKATPTALLEDYAVALRVLRARSEIDPDRIVLYGSSEGTRLAPQLATRDPRGIVGLVLTAYAADNQRTTVEWQNSLGPWRNVTSMIPAAADQRLTRAEWDSAVVRNAAVATQIPFAIFDRDSSGVVEPAEFARVLRPRLDAILQAVNSRNDDFIWQNLLNLSSAYLLDGWDGPPTWEYLLPLTTPIAIVHGDLDGTTRVEGVMETDSVFKARGRTNLSIHVFPGFGHDLGWTPASVGSGGPEPLRRSFDLAATMLLAPRRNR